jgi:hypothetical protein
LVVGKNFATYDHVVVSPHFSSRSRTESVLILGFQATIWKNVGGAYTRLAKRLTVGSGTGELEFQASGSTLMLVLEGNVLAIATDTDLASGSVGLRLGEDATVSSFDASL